ncbi:hypothetical protein NQ317_012437 [Molorchus minor]|uniref:Uncharacterized protein n=1 Tax=Molorchus minor TaxID=1323400 RepID=A0ABQ9JWG9_9CUCU|nr:hypothetical protein NQ317_012437 [Molorchus minor]
MRACRAMKYFPPENRVTTSVVFTKCLYAMLTHSKNLELTKTLNIEEFKNGEHDIAKDDDDSWLNISPEELDKMLQEQYGQKKIFNVNNNTDASIFTEKVTNFLNHVSDIDGAEFPDQGQSPIRPPRRKSKTKVSFSQDTKAEQKASLPNNKINLEPNSFACAVQNILQFMIPKTILGTWKVILI